MVTVQRHQDNPILHPQHDHSWESHGAFNGCAVKTGKNYILLYRALSEEVPYFAGTRLQLSTVGLAESPDGIHFTNRRKFLSPEYDWEKFGCEDPRVVKIGGKYYITYTALGSYPFGPSCIKVGIAITRDFKTIDEKHLMTTFNAKATVMFPEKINGQFAAIVTAHTDMPPSVAGVALFDQETDLWNPDYWNLWHDELYEHQLPLQREGKDHIEIGAPPVKTDKGWILFYSYIRNYPSKYRIFGIEAVLLDLYHPQNIIGTYPVPLLFPEKDYELYGAVPDVVFPTGAVDEGEYINLYYGAVDTTCCVASINKEELLVELLWDKTFPQLRSSLIPKPPGRKKARK